MSYTTTLLAAASNDTEARVDSAVSGLSTWWNDPDTQQNFVTRPLWILLIILVASVLQWVLNRLIRRGAENAIKNPGSGVPFRRGERDVDSPQARSQEQRRQARIRTLSNVGRSAVAIVIWVWAIMAILDQLGVNVAPLVASAGIVGVALGFGAQSLVKDFLSGMFILLENQYGVGDVIAVNDVEGTVEDMTMRITTLRDIDGTLWYIRNGNIEQVGNNSDRFSVARMEVPVSLFADPSKAADVILDAARAAAQSERIRRDIIGEPELLGVSSFTTDHLTYRVTVNTMPGAQWGVSRFMYEQILEAMQEADVRLPGSEPTLVRNDPRDKITERGPSNDQ